MSARFRWLCVLFFVSGFPALLYQIVWQRTLFAIYGVNIESVTIVVSAFMLGLGLGSLAGGRVSKKRSAPLLLIFGAVELGIAAFGLVSLPLFRWVAQFTAGAPPLQTGILSFALVVIPTIGMGATLPLLVSHLVKLSGNVGRSVGILYFVNTLGSAVACFAAALFTMRYLGQSGSVRLAAALNVLVGGTVLVLYFRSPAGEQGSIPERATGKARPALPFPMGLVLAAIAGFISLCYEIVWYRLYSFAAEGRPESFAYVLGAFLAGIAFGSLLVRRLCRAAPSNLARFARSIAGLVLLANLTGFAIVPLVGLMVRNFHYTWTLPLVAIAAGLLGATFPLICHISVGADSEAGAGLSYLYLSNIVGSAAGSWIVGFILMDYWSLRGISVFIALLGVGTAFALLAGAGLTGRQKISAAILASIVCVGLWLSSRPLFATIYSELEYKKDYGQPGTQLTDLVETRSGVVTVDADGAIFGGGVFDGWMTTDLHESNILQRAFAVSLMHPQPAQVLLIGMSGGAWTEILANHPQVREIAVVEINPGYVEVVRRYPAVAPLLSNPKVKLVIDDGRRWMFQHRDRKFDLIVMDTTYYWRSNATNLLSVEFLSLARQMLKEGGILYYNTTFSEAAQHTGAALFPYAFRFGPMLAVSDSPIRLDPERWRQSLIHYTLEGRPVLDLTKPDDVDILYEILHRFDTYPGGDKYVSEGMESRENLLRRTRGQGTVTDDNMLVEWRGGRQ